MISKAKSVKNLQNNCYLYWFLLYNESSKMSSISWSFKSSPLIPSPQPLSLSIYLSIYQSSIILSIYLSIYLFRSFQVIHLFTGLWRRIVQDNDSFIILFNRCILSTPVPGTKVDSMGTIMSMKTLGTCFHGTY
jgi:hypothetical protein